ncbi:MAG: SUMF1/EgtB/PvdO family nonheme iron enzyme [Acetobacteraceae bacterium]
MKLNAEVRAKAERILESDGLDLNELTRMAGLDKRLDFIRANLRNVDFGTSNLAGFNFSQADLSNADLSRATGKDRLVLTDAITTGAIGLPAAWETRDGPHLPALVRIPAGSFMMGALAAENPREKVLSEYAEWSTPQREMIIAQPFWIGKYPVTRGQFAAFVEATGHVIPKGAWTYEPDDKGEWNGEIRDDRDWRNPGFEQTDDHPVVCVSYDDAMAYVHWLRAITRKPYRLLSEAEWEYAARAGTITARFWGDARDPACRYANVADAALMSRTGARFDPDRFFRGDDGYAFTAPVGSFLPNPFGLYDMLGNVWEWCADAWTAKLADLPSDGSANTTGESGRRPVRGGSWYVNPGIVRAAIRGRDGTGHRITSTGFRVARTL